MDIKKIMQEAQKMQKKIQQAQDELESVGDSGAAGAADSVVKGIMSGKGIAKKISISDALIDLEEKAVLEDLIIAAFNNAKSKLDAVVGGKMADLNIPPALLEG